MAADLSVRDVVSASLSDLLQIKRSDLVTERRDMNLNYGSLFLAHQLTSAGADKQEVARLRRDSRSMIEIADEKHADWKQIGTVAKKLNGKIEEHLYARFLSDKADKARDSADNYDPRFDGVQSDVEVSQDDLEAAQDVYTRWKDVAARRPGSSSALDDLTEKQAREGQDHVKTGAPTAGQVGSTGPKN